MNTLEITQKKFQLSCHGKSIRRLLSLIAAILLCNPAAQAVTGELEIRADHRCVGAQETNMKNLAFLMRTTTTNEEYGTWLANGIMGTLGLGVGPYVPRDVRLSNEPFRSSPQGFQIRMALQATRSANNVRITCRRNLAFAHGRAWGENSHDSYFQEQIKMDRSSLSRTFEADPEPIILRAGTALHEILHLFGYDHFRHGREEDYRTSMNQVARHAMQQYIFARLVYPAASSGACLTFNQCRRLGHLVYRRPDGSIKPSFDPSRRGLGILSPSPSGSSLDLRDAALFGNAYSRTGVALMPGPVDRVNPGIWVPENRDRFWASGDFRGASGTGKDFVIRTSYGWAVVRWEPSGTGPGFSTLLNVPSGRVLPGARFSWIPSGNDQLEIVKRNGGDLILAANQSGVALLNPALRDPVLAFIATGQRIAGPRGVNVNWSNDLKLLGVGNFSGEGVEEVLVGGDAGFGVLSFRASAARIYLRQWASNAPGWPVGTRLLNARSDNVRVGDFDGDGVDEWLLRRPNGLVMVKEAGGPGQGFRALAYMRNDIVQGDWRVNTADLISEAAEFDQGNGEQLLVNGASGVGVLRYYRGGMNISRIQLPGRPIVSTSGESAISFRTRDRIDLAGDLLTPPTIGDDGLDVVIRNRDGFGLATVQRSGGRAVSISARSFKRVSCNSDLETCHTALWGNWRIRQSDRFNGRFETRSGDSYLMFGNLR